MAIYEEFLMRKATFFIHDAIDIEASELTEWVRGNENLLLGSLIPLVRARSRVLDFSPVKRVDAAGLSVLVALYRAARESGHSFAIANPAAHVVEILAAVGLDRVLLHDLNEAKPVFEPCLARNAA
jgi:anti-anti-sigma factor